MQIERSIHIMDIAMVVCKLAGAPDLPDLSVFDERGVLVDGCGYSAVGPVGDKGLAVYRVVTSPETIKAISEDPKRWAILDSEKAPDEKAVADRKTLLATDPKLATVLSKETWTAADVHVKTLAALGVTEAQFTDAKATPVPDAKIIDVKPSEEIIDAEPVEKIDNPDF
jgi:hypothetical protein